MAPEKFFLIFVQENEVFLSEFYKVKVTQDQLSDINKTKFSIAVCNLVDVLFLPEEQREMSFSGRLTPNECMTLTKEEADALRTKRSVKQDKRYYAIRGK